MLIVVYSSGAHDESAKIHTFGVRITYTPDYMLCLYYLYMAREVKQGQLADLLYSVMMERNMSVQGLASAIGVQRQTCYAWLHEKQRPGLDMLRRLAHVLNIPLAKLIAATYNDVEATRLESLLEVYLSLTDEKRRLLEAVVSAFEIENREETKRG